MVSFKEARRQNGIQKKYSITQRRSEKRHRASWNTLVTNLKYETNRTQPKVYKILKQTSKDIKETAKIHGNIHENVISSIL